MPIRKDLQNAPEKKRRARRGNMERRPLIGICGGQNEEKTRVMIGKRYTQEILRAGGLPVLLPYTTDKAAIDDILAHMDGLLLAGGEDVHPSRFGEELLPCCGAIDEERDGFELLITQRALELRMPIFGICRGIQVLAVAMGATLFQDIESQLGISKEKHKQTMPFDDNTAKWDIWDSTEYQNAVKCKCEEVNLVFAMHSDEGIEQYLYKKNQKSSG